MSSIPALEPRNSDAVRDAFAAWLANLAGRDVDILSIEPLTGGMDNFVYAVTLAHGTQPSGWPREVVVRICPSIDRYDHLLGESALQQKCFEAGFPAAHVLATIAPTEWAIGHPAQVTAKASGMNVLEVVKSAPQKIALVIRLQAAQHAALHRLDRSTFADVPLRRSIADHRLGDVEREVRNGHIEFTEPLRRIRRAVDHLPPVGDDLAVCHGDFHPLNVLVDCESEPMCLTVIDWTDATIDDRHGDVARTVTLLRVAAIAAGSTGERIALRIIGPIFSRMYLRAYRQHRSVDNDRLRVYEAVHLLNGLAQIAGLANPAVASASAGQEFHPSLITMLERRLERALSAIEHLC